MVKVRFGDLKVGDPFEVYGDEHINYTYPKICDCVKDDESNGREVNGCRFLMGADDMVMLPGEAIQKDRADFKPVSIEPTGKVFLSSSADDLRERGLTVAVHNDYRLNGQAHTFWLFIDESTGLSYKGEGKTDTEALNKVRAQIDELGVSGLNTQQAQAAYKVACSFGVLEGRAFTLLDAMFKAFFPNVKSKKKEK